VKNLGSRVPLTEPAEVREARRLTLPGQADWGVGPETCRECLYWQGGNRMSDGTLKKARCQKAQQLTPGLPAIPHWAPRCKKYFTPNLDPPKVFVK